MRTGPSHSLSAESEDPSLNNVFQKISMKLSNASTCSNWENRFSSHDYKSSFMGLFEEDDETRDGLSEDETVNSCEESFRMDEEEQRENVGSFEFKSFESCNRSEVSDESVVSEESFVSCDVSHSSEEGSEGTEESYVSSVEDSQHTMEARDVFFSSDDHSAAQSSLASRSTQERSVQGYTRGDDATSKTYRVENIPSLYPIAGSATVASHASSAMGKKMAKLASLSRVRHDNDILVEIEVSTSNIFVTCNARP